MQILVFGVLGLASGAIYALLGQGIVLIYRGSGLLNFAQGAMAMVGGYTYYEVGVRLGAPLGVGFLTAVIVSAILGAGIHLVILRPMHGASSLSKVIATLGVLITVQSLAYLLFGPYPIAVPSLLPKYTLHLFSPDALIGLDSVITLGIGFCITLALTLIYGRTSFGRITSAVAENELVATSLGHSPCMVATVNWALGSALAGLAGALIVPQIYVDPSTLVLLIIPSMSAALVGKFSSFPLTFAAAIAFGVANSELLRFVGQPGWSMAVPFVAVVTVLLIRGSGIPLRSHIRDRLPAVGSGLVRPVPVVLAYGAASLIVFSLGPAWSLSVVTTVSFAIICLSVVVVTGYAGQLSLAQAVFAGVGALFAAKLADHVPFLFALLIATAITAAIGVVVGAPAVRTRGAALAIVTLGLGGVLADLVLGNTGYTGGDAGLTVPVPHLFGWNIDPLTHTSRYAFVVLTVLVLLCVGVANLRRGASGRRLLAVRSNERAAVALGVRTGSTKLYAFGLAAAIASIGGILLAFSQTAVEVNGSSSTFTVFMCVVVVGVTVVGGVGSIGGALLGSLLISDGVATQLLGGVSSINEYLALAGGVLLIVTLIFNQDGTFDTTRRALGRISILVKERTLGRERGMTHKRPISAVVNSAPSSCPTIVPLNLRVRDLSVTFGGLCALDRVSFEVCPGQIHGIIGPNGAGKSTFVDAVTGFERASSGSVKLGDQEIGGWIARRRASGGLARTFQSLELFDELTVVEHLAVASDRTPWYRYLTDLFHPGRIELGPASLEALRTCALTNVRNHRPGELSFGRRKMIAIARAVASAPSVLLLDEPAAGLNDFEAADLAQLLRRLAKSWGMGILIIEHNIDIVMQVSDLITVLANGRTIRVGTPAEIANDPAVRDAYLGIPSSLTGSELEELG